MRPICLLVLVLTAAAPQLAAADLLSFHLSALSGGSAGKGLGGTLQDESLYVKAPHFTVGAELGAEIAFIDAWVSHQQFIKSNRTATWTEFGLGFDVDMPLSEKAFAELGFSVGLGLGTGSQVQLPLDKGEITDKGFFGRANVGVGRKFGKYFGLGVRVPVTAGYFFKTGAGLVVNDENTHYQAGSVQALVVATFHLKAK